MTLPPLIEHNLPDDAPTVLSVCSSVGGMDLGLHRAGIRAVGLCEFEPERRKVLGRHWPGVHQWPDLVALADEAEADPQAVREKLGGQPDLLAGGTPCQDLSSAGKRAGLEGNRSVLFWAFIRLRNALGIEWALWENVAGALTSNKGLDFMAVLGAFVGAEVVLPARHRRVNDDGDRVVDTESAPRAGVAAGPWGGCCWRLLNAQHFGVPQRRRRIFVVGRLGGPCPPSILIEPRRDGRDSQAGDAARPLPPWAAACRAGIRRGARLGGEGRGGVGEAGQGPDTVGQPVAGTLGAGRISRSHSELDGHGAYVADVAGALDSQAGGLDDNDARGGIIVGALTAGAGAGNNGNAAGATDRALDVAAALTGGGHPNSAAPGRRREDDVNIVPALNTNSGARLGYNGNDGFVVGADQLPYGPEDRVAGPAEGGRAGADGDEGGGAERDAAAPERAGGPEEADADGVRETAGLAGRVDPASVTEESVDCVKCGASAGEACVTPSGKPARKPHMDRGVDAALLKERLEEEAAAEAASPRALGRDTCPTCGGPRGELVVAPGRFYCAHCGTAGEGPQPADDFSDGFDPLGGAQAVSIRGRDGGATAEVSGEVSPALRGSQGGGSRQYAMVEARPCGRCGHETHASGTAGCLKAVGDGASICPCTEYDADAEPARWATWVERSLEVGHEVYHVERGRATPMGDRAPCLTQPAGDDFPLVASFYGNDHTASSDASPPLRADPHGDANVPVAFAKAHGAADAQDAEHWKEGEVARSVNPHDARRSDGGGMLVGYHTDGRPADTTQTVDTLGMDPRVRQTTTIAVNRDLTEEPTVLDTYNQSEVEGGVTNTLSTSPTTAVGGQPGAERCTLESPCARCRELDPPPDGFRYAAAGDGVAAPCAHFIGLRINAAIKALRMKRAQATQGSGA